MLKCPYCGSHRLQTTGGEYGNPFDRRPEKTICLDCGRTIGADGTDTDLFQSVICVEMTAVGGGLVYTAKAEFPFEDGEYDLSRLLYPLCRYKSLKVNGSTAIIDGDIYISIIDASCETTKKYTAYALDKRPEEETIKIRIYSDIK